ncbi:MAG: alpha/beta fold hydrolase [Dehalococcoidia bacterium]
MAFKQRALQFAALVGGAFASLKLYAPFAVRRFEDLGPETAGAPGLFIDVAGVRLHYVEAGRGEPVVLIHGLNGSTFGFRYTIPELARSFRVVAFDLKGCGYSARPAKSDYSLTAHAELVAHAMAALGIERAAVVGHSLGGAIAMRLASRFPQRVERLILVDSATDRDVRRGLRTAWLARPLSPVIAMLTLHRKGFRRRVALTLVHDPAHFTPELIEAFFYTSRMKGHARALSLLAAHRGRDEPLDLTTIHAPTLILWGEHDRWLPIASGEELARALPNARLDAVPSAGHLPLEEQVAYCNRALLSFLGSAEGNVATAPAPPTGAKTVTQTS